METSDTTRKVALKTFLKTILILIVIGAAVVGIQHWRWGSRYREEQIQRARTLAVALAVTERDQILDHRFQDVGRDFAEIVGQPGIAYLVVMDNTGRAVAHTDAKFQGRKLTDDISKKALDTSERILEQRSGKVADIAVSVMSATQRVGVVRVGIQVQD